jgi:peroxiredoxin
LVDFDTNVRLLESHGIKVVAGSVDSVNETDELAQGLRLRSLKMVAELDAHQVAEATGAFLHSGDRAFLHATGFVIDPEGRVVNAVYSTGPIGRFTANDVMKKVTFEQKRRADEG